ncbi:MAG: hypothetical protein KAH21_02300 [Spirochaetaceae bacterium]|nr:hypothetical protein [Spirochaetaceae bacterium]
MKLQARVIMMFFLCTFSRGLYAENLIPRRVFFKGGAEIPEMITDVLFTSIAEYNPIVAVGENGPRHNTVETTVINDEIWFVLSENEVEIDSRNYPFFENAPSGNLLDNCRDTAEKWSVYLSMVPPKVNKELIYEKKQLSEEVDLELRLATDFQFSLWLPVSLVMDFLENDDMNFYTVKYAWPVGAEFSWFFKNNVGLSTSLAYENDNHDNQVYNRIIPSAGFIFRTLGRLSMEFALRLNLFIINVSDNGASYWQVYPTFEIAPVISWNFNDFLSLKILVFGFYLDPIYMFSSGDVERNRNQITLLNLGIAYRW